MKWNICQKTTASVTPSRKGAQRGSQTAPEVKTMRYTKMKWRRGCGPRRKVRRERKLQKARPATITSFHWGYKHRWIATTEPTMDLLKNGELLVKILNSYLIPFWQMIIRGLLRRAATCPSLMLLQHCSIWRIHRSDVKRVFIVFNPLNVESRWTTITLSTTKQGVVAQKFTEDWSIETEVYVSSIYFLDARRRDDKATIRHLRSLCSLNLLAVKDIASLSDVKTSIRRENLRFVSVYDVGQGNANAVLHRR